MFLLISQPIIGNLKHSWFQYSTVQWYSTNGLKVISILKIHGYITKKQVPVAMEADIQLNFGFNMRFSITIYMQVVWSNSKFMES